MAFEAELEVARGAGIQQPPPLRLARPDIESGVHLPVDHHGLALLAGDVVVQSERCGAAVFHGQVLDNHNMSLEGRERVRLVLYYQRPGKAVPHVPRRQPVVVRVVEAHGAGLHKGGIELILELLARADVEEYIIGPARWGDMPAVGVQVDDIEPVVDDIPAFRTG